MLRCVWLGLATATTPTIPTAASTAPRPGLHWNARWRCAASAALSFRRLGDVPREAQTRGDVHRAVSECGSIPTLLLEPHRRLCGVQAWSARNVLLVDAVDLSRTHDGHFWNFFQPVQCSPGNCACTPSVLFPVGSSLSPADDTGLWIRESPPRFPQTRV